MSAKYTKGPWIIKDRIKTDEFIPVGPKDNVHVALVYSYKFDRIELVNQEWQANARLIAAAPSMLEALEYIFSELNLVVGEEESALQDCLKTASEAIRKAKGEA